MLWIDGGFYRLLKMHGKIYRLVQVCIVIKKLQRFFIFLVLTAGFLILHAYTIEHFDILELHKQAIIPAFTEKDGRLHLAWTPLPYPCYYKVETLTDATGIVPGGATDHIFDETYTLTPSLDVPRTAIPTAYRVTAYGIFGKVGGADAPIANPDFPKTPKAPVPISHYDTDAPASLMPFLIWHTVPGAVCYELELLSSPPDEEGGTSLAGKPYHLESTREIFTNGWQADLRQYADRKILYWRVRALDIRLQPIGEFSKASAIVLDANLPLPSHPLLNEYDQMPNFKQPLYPVYNWIPLHGIMRYEVELMTTPPAHPNNKQPDAGRAWSKIVNSAMACYDEYPRPYAGDYYWRVRAVDAEGNPIGTWSDAAHFIVAEQPRRVKVAVLGDSITHGGGSVSSSPSALEYSYTTYFDFPCLNLGRSGDTSRMTRDRFEQDVLPFHPENLLILTGSNSLRSAGISAQDVIDDLAAIQDKCRAHDIRPIFLTLMPINPRNIRFAFHSDTDPDWDDKLHIINTWIRKQEYSIDLEPYFYDDTGDQMDAALSVDGLHPDIRGKMLMGEIVNASKAHDLLK